MSPKSLCYLRLVWALVVVILFQSSVLDIERLIDCTQATEISLLAVQWAPPHVCVLGIHVRRLWNEHWHCLCQTDSTHNCSAHSVTSPSAHLINTCGQTNTFPQPFLPCVTKQVTDLLSNCKPKCTLREATTIPTAENIWKNLYQGQKHFLSNKKMKSFRLKHLNICQYADLKKHQ